MGPIRCPETSVNNYYTTRSNTPEDRRFHTKFYWRQQSLQILTVGGLSSYCKACKYWQLVAYRLTAKLANTDSWWYIVLLQSLQILTVGGISSYCKACKYWQLVAYRLTAKLANTELVAYRHTAKLANTDSWWPIVLLQSLQILTVAGISSYCIKLNSSVEHQKQIWRESWRLTFNAWRFGVNTAFSKNIRPGTLSFTFMS
jgi:hypothetical protein